jgi:hypothetical protein
MIDRFRALSPALRRSVYFGGVILVFLVAVGVGAAAMFVAGRPSGHVAAGSGVLEGTEAGTTGPAEASESTGIEPSRDSGGSDGTAYGAPFVHRADPENSQGDYTYIKNPNTDGNANAVVLVSSAAAPAGSGTARYGHNIGVWYEPEARRWAIFNQDRGPVPAGATFELVVPQPAAGFVHRAKPADTVGNATYLRGPLTAGKPHITVRVTQNWNPGGGSGVFNDHPIDIIYDHDVDQWAIYNRDGAAIPDGAAFNVSVSADAGGSAR